MKILLTLFLILDFGYHLLFTVLNNKQRSKPLPKEVNDIYDEKRYQTFINYKSEYSYYPSHTFRNVRNNPSVVFVAFATFLSLGFLFFCVGNLLQLVFSCGGV